MLNEFRLLSFMHQYLLTAIILNLITNPTLRILHFIRIKCCAFPFFRPLFFQITMSQCNQIMFPESESFQQYTRRLDHCLHQTKNALQRLTSVENVRKNMPLFLCSRADNSKFLTDIHQTCSHMNFTEISWYLKGKNISNIF